MRPWTMVQSDCTNKKSTVEGGLIYEEDDIKRFGIAFSEYARVEWLWIDRYNK